MEIDFFVKYLETYRSHMLHANFSQKSSTHIIMKLKKASFRLENAVPRIVKL